MHIDAVERGGSQARKDLIAFKKEVAEATEKYGLQNYLM